MPNHARPGFWIVTGLSVTAAFIFAIQPIKITASVDERLLELTVGGDPSTELSTSYTCEEWTALLINGNGTGDSVVGAMGCTADNAGTACFECMSEYTNVTFPTYTLPDPSPPGYQLMGSVSCGPAYVGKCALGGGLPLPPGPYCKDAQYNNSNCYDINEYFAQFHPPSD